MTLVMLMSASCLDGFYLVSLESWQQALGFMSGQCWLETYRAGSRVGDLPSVGHPLVIGTLLVSKGSIEDHSNVSHGVDTHCRAFENRAASKGEKKQKKNVKKKKNCQKDNKNGAK